MTTPFKPPPAKSPVREQDKREPNPYIPQPPWTPPEEWVLYGTTPCTAAGCTATANVYTTSPDSYTAAHETAKTPRVLHSFSFGTTYLSKVTPL